MMIDPPCIYMMIDSLHIYDDRPLCIYMMIDPPCILRAVDFDAMLLRS